MNVTQYLERIGIHDMPEPTLASLRRIQRSHLFSVPYENLDIVAGKALSLKLEDLYDKIVVNHRGGYCFEVNELYGWLLRQLGYHVTDCFARFLRNDTGIPKRRHHVLKVDIPGEPLPYLCDVGVGTGSPTYPIRLEENILQTQGIISYRMVTDDFLGWILEEEKHGEWKSIFSFTEEPQLPQDFVAISFFCEKSQDSIFNKAPIISMRTETGRRTLDGNAFKEFSGDQVTVHIVDDESERARYLREWFGMQL